MLLITVNHNSRDPPYKQIYDQIVYSISIGNLRKGDAIPPSRVLAGTLDVNYHTVNKAYQQLRENGIISLSKRRRYVVTEGNRDIRSVDEFFLKEEEIIDDAIARGLRDQEIIEAVKKILTARSKKRYGD